MAYQNVGTPRFYVDHIQFLKAMNFDFISHHNKTYFTDKNTDGYGIAGSDSNSVETYLSTSEFWTLSPHKRINPGWANMGEGESNASQIYKSIDTPTTGAGLEGDNIGKYFAILNHNLGASASGAAPLLYCELKNQTFEGGDWVVEGVSAIETNVLNYGYTDRESGSTIFRIKSTDDGFSPANNNICYQRLVFAQDLTGDTFGYTTRSLSGISFGGLSTGIYYDMPHSPDLKLTMDINYDGYDITTTRGGGTLVNVRYSGAPLWRDSEEGNTSSQRRSVVPFQIGDLSNDDGGIWEQAQARRTGRRSWNLKFSYLSDKDLFASNYMPTNYLETDTGYDSADIDTSNNVFNYTIDSDNSFMSLVWQKTLGGALPFIFQPDNTNNNPDQFCIARFDQKSLKISQVANSVYNVSLKIIETW